MRLNSVNVLAYTLYIGEIPDGLYVCHRCDNPTCCNPDHLFLGTHADNVRDMHYKSRGVRDYYYNGKN
jgi:HNH endonuclease